MAAGSYDFSVEQGTTLDAKFLWKDGSGNPISLTGYTSRMQVRSTVESVTVLNEFTTENSGITFGPGTGEFHVKASATATAAWTFSSGVYDLEMVSAAGVVTRLLKGKFSVDPEVTR